MHAPPSAREGFLKDAEAGNLGIRGAPEFFSRIALT
jgi:hypothetical protein